MGSGGQKHIENREVEDTGLILPPIPSQDDRSLDPEV